MNTLFSLGFDRNKLFLQNQSTYNPSPGRYSRSNINFISVSLEYPSGSKVILEPTPDAFDDDILLREDNCINGFYKASMHQLPPAQFNTIYEYGEAFHFNGKIYKCDVVDNPVLLQSLLGSTDFPEVTDASTLDSRFFHKTEWISINGLTSCIKKKMCELKNSIKGNKDISSYFKLVSDIVRLRLIYIALTNLYPVNEEFNYSSLNQSERKMIQKVLDSANIICDCCC